MRETSGSRRRKGRTRLREARGALTGLLAALALVVQLLAVPYHQAHEPPGFAATSASVVAALKATFGDAAALCVEPRGKGAPLSSGECDDQCLLCRFASQAGAVVAPNVPALAARFAAAATVGAAAERGAVPLFVSQPNRARAPPLPA